MYSFETQIRVRYGETDKMGIVYHGNYPQYLEIGRTALMRDLGFTYSRIEEMGYILPVRTMKINFMEPGYYDEVLTLKTYLKSMPTVRIKFDYELFNQNMELMSTAEIMLAFVDNISRRPVKPPQEFIEAVSKFFK